MGNRLHITCWHHHLNVIDYQISCLEELLEIKRWDQNSVHRVIAEKARVSNLKKQTNILLSYLAKKDEGMGVLVGIVPAQEYRGADGGAFFFTRNGGRIVSGYLDTWMVSGAVAALYRSFAHSCAWHNQGRVMLVHMPQDAGALELGGGLLTKEDGVLSHIVLMAKNQTVPFQEVHIGIKREEDGLSFLVDVGPKAIMVG